MANVNCTCIWCAADGADTDTADEDVFDVDPVASNYTSTSETSVDDDDTPVIVVLYGSRNYRVVVTVDPVEPPEVW